MVQLRERFWKYLLGERPVEPITQHPEYAGLALHTRSLEQEVRQAHEREIALADTLVGLNQDHDTTIRSILDGYMKLFDAQLKQDSKLLVAVAEELKRLGGNIHLPGKVRNNIQDLDQLLSTIQSLSRVTDVTTQYGAETNNRKLGTHNICFVHVPDGPYRFLAQSTNALGDHPASKGVVGFLKDLNGTYQQTLEKGILEPLTSQGQIGTPTVYKQMQTGQSTLLQELLHSQNIPPYDGPIGVAFELTLQKQGYAARLAKSLQNKGRAAIAKIHKRPTTN